MSLTKPPEATLADLVENRCPLRIPRHMSAGCCTWDTFLHSFAGAWARWFDVPPNDQQWRMAKRDWVSGNTGWEAAHNAQARMKDRVAKRQHEAWAASGAVITTARAGR